MPQTKNRFFKMVAVRDRLRDVDSVGGGSKMKGSHCLSRWLLTQRCTTAPLVVVKVGSITF